MDSPFPPCLPPTPTVLEGGSVFVAILFGGMGGPRWKAGAGSKQEARAGGPEIPVSPCAGHPGTSCPGEPVLRAGANPTLSLIHI